MDCNHILTAIRTARDYAREKFCQDCGLVLERTERNATSKGRQRMTKAIALLQDSIILRHIGNADYVAVVHEIRKMSSPIEAAYVTACVVEGLSRARSRALVQALGVAVNASVDASTTSGGA